MTNLYRTETIRSRPRLIMLFDSAPGTYVEHPKQLQNTLETEAVAALRAKSYQVRRLEDGYPE